MVTQIFTVCKTADDALVVVEALSAQIESHRNALDHRSLFSAAFNRKMTNKIELLCKVREAFLVYSGELKSCSIAQDAHDRAVLHGKNT